MADLVPDTGIALGIRTPQAGGPDLGTLGTFARTQNWLNSAALFRQTFSARQRAGEIMASSPDIDTAIGTIQRDPLAGAFAPELVNMMRQIELTQTQIAGNRQTQAQSAIGQFMKSMAGAYQDPSRLESMVRANVSLLPAGPAGDQARKAMGDIIEGLTGDLPQDPAKASAMFRLRMQGVMTAGGMTPELQSAVTGTPVTENIGGSLLGGVRGPAAAGGGLTFGSATPMTQPPGFQQPGAVPVGGSAGPTGLALPATSPTPPGPNFSPNPAGGEVQPVVQPNLKMPSYPQFVGGMSPAQVENSKNIQEGFKADGPAQKQYENALTTRATLQEMGTAFDTLQRDGGLQVPGAASEFRNTLAGAFQTLKNATGIDVGVGDAGKVASYQDLQKATKRLGLSVLTSTLGNQREAAVTIQSITGAVPNASNSYIGGQLIKNILTAGANRQIDERQFMNSYMDANRGFISPDAQTEFNKAYPIEAYLHKAYDNFEGDMKGAVTQGLISRDDAASALRIVLTAQKNTKVPGEEAK